MSGGHVHALFRHGTSGVHRTAPHVKVLSTLAFVVAVVMTPREQLWAFGVHLLILVTVITWARLPIRFVVTRMVVLLPFLVAAWTLPLLGSDPVNGFGLSIEGLWGAWNITAKGVLGTMASVALAATTEIPDLVGGLERLRVPRVVTSIIGFMARYLETVVGDLERTRIAMRSRGYRPRWLGSVGALGRSIGALFVRTFERGERVYLAMVARGYAGRMPDSGTAAASPRMMVAAAALVTPAWIVAISAIITG